MPLFIKDLKPSRIDLFIPSQTRHPPFLRYALDSYLSFCILDSRTAKLGIGKHLLRALESWTEELGEDKIEDSYRNAPFGSRIIVDSISADPKKKMRFGIIKDFTSERQMLPFTALQSMWNLTPNDYPPTIDINQLRLIRILHDTVSIVSLYQDMEAHPVIFKTSPDIRYSYHELKLLLSMEKHPGIISKPLYIVTGVDRYGGNDKVFGFILPLFPKGNSTNELTRRRANGTLTLADGLRWAEQITETLIAINASSARFYSELKPDNLLLDDDDNVLFIDFEQAGIF